jgi:hypothetical protein
LLVGGWSALGCRTAYDPCSVPVAAKRPTLLAGWKDSDAPPPIISALNELKQSAVGHVHDARSVTRRRLSAKTKVSVRGTCIRDVIIWLIRKKFLPKAGRGVHYETE